MIMCIAKDGTIGDKNQLPWHLPADLKRFKALTEGHTVIMGRKTQQSIGQPLPNRENIVITRNPRYQADGYKIAHSLDHALHTASHEKIFIIGGTRVFSQAEKISHKAYLTIVNANFNGNIKYNFDHSEWLLQRRSNFTSSEENRYSYSFIEYGRL